MSLMELTRCLDLPFRDRWPSISFDEDVFDRIVNTENGVYFPADIYEKDGNIHVRAELPGISKDDIDIEIKDGLLTLKSEKQEEKEVKEDAYYVKECRIGRYKRSFRLPDDIDEENVSADLKDGILSITLPRKQEVKVKKIEIH